MLNAVRRHCFDMLDGPEEKGDFHWSLNRVLLFIKYIQN